MPEIACAINEHAPFRLVGEKCEHLGKLRRHLIGIEALAVHKSER
ncbi:MAG: hypothetical protein Q7J47_12060 [Azoarcus sp.]|nr:hypothetical protein [Azoarcus sp.]